MSSSHISHLTSGGGFSPSAKIYVAGHRGLVGSAIVRKLLESGLNPQSLIRRTSSELDLCDSVAVTDFFEQERPEYVFLAAALVGGIMANSTYPADFIRNNLQIQTNVIDAAYRHGVKKLLFLGSSCIYPKFAPQPMKEEYLLTGELEPTNEWYAIAKIAGIKTCQAYRRQYGFHAISLMPTNLYGPNDTFDLMNSHVLPALIRKFHLAKLAMEDDVEAIADDEARYGPIPDDILSSLGLVRSSAHISRLPSSVSHAPRVDLWGTGSPRREFLHVDDLADAALFLMRNYDSDKVINVGVGEDMPIRELAELVREVVGFEGETVWDASKPDGMSRKLLDVSRISRLGWKAETSLAKGIGDVYRWYCVI